MNNTEVAKALVKSSEQFGLGPTLLEVFGSNFNIDMRYSLKACDVSIDELELSVRSNNCLKRANVFTIGELIDRFNAENVKGTRNLGAKSYSEIQYKIIEYGYERLTDREKEDFFKRVIALNRR